MEADKGSRLRMRRQDVNAKEAELDLLIQSHKGKLEDFLSCRGTGDLSQCSGFCYTSHTHLLRGLDQRRYRYAPREREREKVIGMCRFATARGVESSS